MVIDEVQQVPQLLNEVHRLIEGKGLRFVLTGSSARGLRKKGVNLLAGRVYTYHPHPLTAAELGPDYTITEALRYGLLPSVWNEGEDKKKYLESYVRTYLEQEILLEPSPASWKQLSFLRVVFLLYPTLPGIPG